MPRWASSLGAGPFILIERSTVTEARYRGRPTTVDLSLALAHVGPVQIELIEQHGGHPSAYRDSVPEGQTGFHHIGRLTDDLDAEYARFSRMGADTVYEGLAGDARFAYFDARAQVGCMLEYIQRRPSVERLFAAVAEASRAWDGRELVRTLPA
jgi:hypothetical protein